VRAFASSQGLYDGIYTLDAYVAPLLGALTPAIWSFQAIRGLAVIIFSLGQPISGTQGSAAELLQILPSVGTFDSTAVPKVGPMASTDAVNWWQSRTK
jgi:hypothetical protein